MQFSLDTSLPIQFEVIEQIEDSRFLRGKIWICHTGENLNRSYFSKEVIQNAIPSLSNIPVLGFIEVNNLNEADFRGHEQRLVIDKDGVKIEYLGRMYGTVPESNNAKFEMKLCDDGIEREFLTAEVLIHTKFQEAVDIIQRDGVKNHSMELHPPSIQGKFNKQKLFEFTEFKFEGLCLLGNDVTPAMKGSVLELFSQISIKEQFSDMINEFNEFYFKYTENQSPKEIDNNIQEGGDQVNEKLELFTNFPTLKDEDVAELKNNIEQYSLEELEAKLNELVEKQEQDNPNTEFALTAQQLEQEIRNALSQERVTDRWGDSVRAYWYIDHDDNRVYAEDAQNGYLPVGLTYSKNGDLVVVDFTSKKRIKWVPQDVEGETDVSASFVSIERNEFEVAKVKEDTTKEVEAKFESVQTELNEIKPQFETLKTEKQELEIKVNEFTSTDSQKQIDDLKKEIQDLNAYKLGREKQDKLDIINKFSQLTDDEKKPFIDEVDKFSPEELEIQLFAVVGKKGISNFSKQNKEHLVFSLSTDIKTNDSNQPAWAELVEQYKSKNK